MIKVPEKETIWNLGVSHKGRDVLTLWIILTAALLLAGTDSGKMASLTTASDRLPKDIACSMGTKHKWN